MRDLIFRLKFPVRVWLTQATEGTLGALLARDAKALEQTVEIKSMKILKNIVQDDVSSATRILFEVALLASAQLTNLRAIERSNVGSWWPTNWFIRLLGVAYQSWTP